MKTLFVVSLILSSTISFASGRESGGGASIVCRNKSGTITSAKLYDTYAAANDSRAPKDLFTSNAPIPAQIESALERIAAASSFKDDALEKNKTVSFIRRALALVERDWVPLKANTRLPFTPDVEPDFLPSDSSCQLETTAHYDDTTSTLLVDMEIYKKLSITDQVALKFHEAFYKIGRVFQGAQNSKQTRAVVGQLFSKLKNSSDSQHLENLVSDYYLALSSDNTATNFNAARFDVFLGGKSLYCENINDPKEHFAFQYTRNSDDAETGMSLVVSEDSSLDATNSMTPSLRRLPTPESYDAKTKQYALAEDWLVLEHNDSDIYNLQVRYRELQDDESYKQGKLVATGTFKYENERDVGNYSAELLCGFR